MKINCRAISRLYALVVTDIVKYFKQMARLSLFILMIFTGISCSQKAEIQALQGQIMGTYYSVKVAADSKLNKKALGQDVQKELDRLNQIFSTYETNSELSQLNQAEAGKWINISDEMRQVLLASKKVHEETDGYFDVTVGPIVNAWGFGPDGKQKRPTLEELKSLKAATGMNLFEVQENKFRKKEKDIYIDLSAVAKGYAVDKIMEHLKENGHQSALVEIGGETRTSGKKPGGSPWLVGVEKPTTKLGGGVQVAVKLSDMSIATSGSYRNFVKYGDQVFSHTIDPKTGLPARNNVISVTVLASTCALADAYATAMLAMGHEKGMLLAEKLRLPAYFLVKKDENIDIVMTDSFKQFIQEI